MGQFSSLIVSPEYGGTPPWWITGFADGESWFRMYKINKGTSWTFSFGIKLRDDDINVIVGLSAIFEASMYRGWDSEASRVRNNRVGSKPQVALSAHKKESLGKVIWHFDHYPLQSKKLRDYRIWREAALLWYDAPTAMEVGEIPFVQGKMRGMYRKKSSAVVSEVEDLADRLKSGRAYRAPKTFVLQSHVG